MAFNYSNILQKRKLIFPFLLLSLFFLGCSIKKELYVSNQTFTYDDFILIDVQINDTLKGKMIFDTGSNHTILEEKYNQNIRLKKSVITDFYQNTDVITYGKIDKIAFGSVEINRPQIRFYNLSKYFDSKENIIGILGTDIIKKFCWEFSFQDNSLTISKKPYENKLELEVLSVDYDRKSKINDRLKVNNQIINNNLILDSGNLCQIALSAKEVINKNDFQTELNFSKSLASSQHKVSEIHFTNSGILSVNKKKQDSVQIIYSDFSSNAVGLEIFEKTHLVFDGVSKKLYFSNFQKHKINPESKQGFRFSKNNNDIIVKSVILNGIAHKKGLKVGDKLIYIDKLDVHKSKNISIDSLNNNRSKIQEITVLREDNQLLNFSFIR